MSLELFGHGFDLAFLREGQDLDCTLDRDLLGEGLGHLLQPGIVGEAHVAHRGVGAKDWIDIEQEQGVDLPGAQRGGQLRKPSGVGRGGGLGVSWRLYKN
jgi:hypothetical protein